MNRKKLTTIISISLTIIILSLLGLFLAKNIHVFKELKNIKLSYTIYAYIATLTTLYLGGLTIKLLATPFKIELKEHFSLSIAAGFINLITPFRGGAGLRAVYMKKKHGLSYSHFLASLFGNYIVIFLVSPFITLLSLYYIYLKHGIFNIYLTLFFLALFLGTLFIVLFHKNQFKSNNIITSKLNKVIEGWKIIKKNKATVIKITLLTFITIIISGFLNQIVFLALGVEINLIIALYFSGVGLISMFLNFTPGSLGITETIYLISATIIGISPEISVLAALIIRAVRISFLITLGPLFNIMLAKKIKKT